MAAPEKVCRIQTAMQMEGFCHMDFSNYRITFL
jgi:hypothetical protein